MLHIRRVRLRRVRIKICAAAPPLTGSKVGRMVLRLLRCRIVDVHDDFAVVFHFGFRRHDGRQGDRRDLQIRKIDNINVKYYGWSVKLQQCMENTIEFRPKHSK